MRSWCLAVTLCLCAPVAVAQFKWVDNTGRIGFGDKPPAGAHDIEPLDGYLRGAQPDPGSELPYELRRTVKAFPVTLYTMAKCAGCDRGRSLLKDRSVPFSERTIESAKDVQALKQLTGTDQLPVLQVGGRVLSGFNSATWADALDLARYPQDSQLPVHWVWPAPKPLTEPEPAQAAAQAAPTPAAAGTAQ
jgi:glutaredoxin